MVTKSLAVTPFGKKLVYTIDGECIWSEYLPFTKAQEPILPVHRPEEVVGVFGQLRRGMRQVLTRRAS